MEDPENMRRSMRAAMDPEYMRAMMQQQDRAMANITSHPEGFNALRRAHNEIGAPMLEVKRNVHTDYIPYENRTVPLTY